MRIYAEVLPTTLGKVMYRINKALKQYAPPGIEFVSKPEDADLQILDSIGTGSIPFIYKENYVLLQWCYITAEASTKDFWMPYWKKAKLVAAFMNLPEMTTNFDFNFIRIPVGVDPSTFYRENLYKVYKVMTTGYVAETECIKETLEAAEYFHGKIAHVGGNLFPNNKSCGHFENISDSDMRRLYNQSYYIAGMRKTEGFEAPLIEGTLCGCRGITLDYPNYRYWFGDLMEYITDGDYNFVKDQLIDLFSKPYRAVTQQEMDLVKEKFSWEKVMNTLWTKILEVT